MKLNDAEIDRMTRDGARVSEMPNPLRDALERLVALLTGLVEKKAETIINVPSPTVNVAAPVVNLPADTESETSWEFTIKRDTEGRMKTIKAVPN